MRAIIRRRSSSSKTSNLEYIKKLTQSARHVTAKVLCSHPTPSSISPIPSSEISHISYQQYYREFIITSDDESSSDKGPLKVRNPDPNESLTSESDEDSKVPLTCERPPSRLDFYPTGGDADSEVPLTRERPPSRLDFYSTENGDDQGRSLSQGVTRETALNSHPPYPGRFVGEANVPLTFSLVDENDSGVVEHNKEDEKQNDKFEAVDKIPRDYRTFAQRMLKIPGSGDSVPLAALPVGDSDEEAVEHNEGNAKQNAKLGAVDKIQHKRWKLTQRMLSKAKQRPSPRFQNDSSQWEVLNGRRQDIREWLSSPPSPWVRTQPLPVPSIIITPPLPSIVITPPPPPIEDNTPLPLSTPTVTATRPRLNKDATHLPAPVSALSNSPKISSGVGSPSSPFVSVLPSKLAEADTQHLSSIYVRRQYLAKLAEIEAFILRLEAAAEELGRLEKRLLEAR